MPSSSAWPRARPPLLDQLTQPSSLSSENPQEASLFFTRLPSEVRRLIYVEVWRTFGSDAYGPGDAGPDAQYHACTTGNLSPHITAAMTPASSSFPSPLSAEGGGAASRAPARPPLLPWAPIMAQGFTSAPCFLAVDDDDDGHSHGHSHGHGPGADHQRDDGRSVDNRPSPRRAMAPEDGDVRPAKLAAAHMQDLDAVAVAVAGGDGRRSDDAPETVVASDWRARWNSPWNGHWTCEEYYTGGRSSGSSSSSSSHSGSARGRRRPPLRRPYLPVLQTCRRAYVEGIDLLYSALTFQFTDSATARRFLERWPCVASVRLALKLPSSVLDLYRGADGDDGVGVSAAEAASSAAPVAINARHNVWQLLCAGFDPDHLPNLRRLHVWVEAHDLRGWHRAAAETRIFARLLQAVQTVEGEVEDEGEDEGQDEGPGEDKAKGQRNSDAIARIRRRRAALRRPLPPENVVLFLPTLPADPAARGLPGCYLGEVPDHTDGAVGTDAADAVTAPHRPTAPPRPLPCTIVRSERPDYWDVHLNLRPVFVNRRLSIGGRTPALRQVAVAHQ